MTVIFGVVSVVHDEIHFLDRRIIQSWALPGPLDARISCHTGIETIGGGVLHDLPQLLRQRFRLLFALPFPEDRLPEAGEELLLIGQDLVRTLLGDVLDGRIALVDGYPGEVQRRHLHLLIEDEAVGHLLRLDQVVERFHPVGEGPALLKGLVHGLETWANGGDEGAQLGDIGGVVLPHPDRRAGLAHLVETAGGADAVHIPARVCGRTCRQQFRNSVLLDSDPLVDAVGEVHGFHCEQLFYPAFRRI